MINNLQSLVELQETCLKSLEEIQSKSENLNSILDSFTVGNNNQEQMNLINEIKAKQERLINLAKNGDMNSVMELTKELNQQYGRNNK